MKRIIICGNENQVYEIKQRLNTQNSSVISFDLSKECFSKDISKSETLFIAADDFQKDLILTLLSVTECDIKLINFSCFKRTSFENPIKNINNDVHYTGLIVGMSHSQCAIRTELLKDNVYCNCAAPSMDIFCHFHYLKKISEIYPEKLKNMRHIIIELPYYIFNYDLSRFGNFVYSKLNYFELVGDYHNFGKTEAQKNIINEFRLFKEYFRPEKIVSKCSSKKNVIRNMAKSVLNKYRIAVNKDKVWRVIYQETVEENRKLWGDILALLEKNCPNARVTVLVMPFNPLFRLFHKKEISQMKKIFKASLGTGRFEVVDHFSCINSDYYFDDHCHLNEIGASKYTFFLQEELANE